MAFRGSSPTNTTSRGRLCCDSVSATNSMRPSASAGRLPSSVTTYATTRCPNLAAPDGPELVLIERLDTPHPLRAFMPLGSRIPLHASATGIAFLAASTDDFIARYLSQPLDPQTEHTITDPDRLSETIELVRTRGYSVNEQGLNTGITALGASIVNAQREPIGSVSISGPSSRITAEKFARFGSAVRETAHRISAAL